MAADYKNFCPQPSVMAVDGRILCPQPSLMAADIRNLFLQPSQMAADNIILCPQPSVMAADDRNQAKIGHSLPLMMVLDTQISYLKTLMMVADMNIIREISLLTFKKKWEMERKNYNGSP